jgi:hypothetical protein
MILSGAGRLGIADCIMQRRDDMEQHIPLSGPISQAVAASDQGGQRTTC